MSKVLEPYQIDRCETDPLTRIKLKRILGLWFLREIRLTSYQSVHGTVMTIHRTKERISSNRKEPKKQSIQSSALCCHVNNLPILGEDLGFTKDECIQRLLCFDRLDLGCFISFNRRIGLVPLANAWVLFVRIRPERTGSGDFSNNRRQIDFFVSLKSTVQCRILRDIDDTSTTRKKILVAIRFSQGKYIFYGECKCISKSIAHDLIKLVLELETSLPSESAEQCCD